MRRTHINRRHTHTHIHRVHTIRAWHEMKSMLARASRYSIRLRIYISPEIRQCLVGVSSFSVVLALFSRCWCPSLPVVTVACETRKLFRNPRPEIVSRQIHSAKRIAKPINIFSKQLLLSFSLSLALYFCFLFFFSAAASLTISNKIKFEINR